MLACVVVALGACQQSPADDLAGDRALMHEGRLYLLTCDEVRDDRLGDPVGSVPFEDRSLEVRRISEVADHQALAAKWDECPELSSHDNWILAVPGRPGETPDVSDFADVLEPGPR